MGAIVLAPRTNSLPPTPNPKNRKWRGQPVDANGWTASYTGGATGVYQLHPFASYGAGSAAGRFTADVSLSVNFGTNTDAASLQLDMSNIAFRTHDGKEESRRVTGIF